MLQLRALQNAAGRRSSASSPPLQITFGSGQDQPEWCRREEGEDGRGSNSPQQQKKKKQQNWQQQLHKKQTQQASSTQSKQQSQQQQSQQQHSQQQQSQQQEQNHQQPQKAGAPQPAISSDEDGTCTAAPVDFLSRLMSQLQHPGLQQQEDGCEANTDPDENSTLNREDNSADIDPVNTNKNMWDVRPGTATDMQPNRTKPGSQSRQECFPFPSNPSGRMHDSYSGTDNNSANLQRNGSAGASSDDELFLSPDPWTLHSSGEDDIEPSSAQKPSHSIWQSASPDAVHVAKTSVKTHRSPEPAFESTDLSASPWKQQHPDIASATADSPDAFSFDLMSRQGALAQESHGSTTPNISSPQKSALGAGAVGGPGSRVSGGGASVSVRQTSVSGAHSRHDQVLSPNQIPDFQVMVQSVGKTNQSTMYRSTAMGATTHQQLASFVAPKPMSPRVPTRQKQLQLQQQQLQQQQHDLRLVPEVAKSVTTPMGRASPPLMTHPTAPRSYQPTIAKPATHGSSPASSQMTHEIPLSRLMTHGPGSQMSDPNATSHMTQAPGPYPGYIPSLGNLATYYNTSQPPYTYMPPASRAVQYLSAVPMIHVTGRHPAQYKLSEDISSLDALARSMLSPRNQAFKADAQQSINNVLKTMNGPHNHEAVLTRPQTTGQFHPNWSLHVPSGKTISQRGRPVSSGNLSLSVARPASQNTRIARPTLTHGDQSGPNKWTGQRGIVKVAYPGSALLCAVQMPALCRAMNITQTAAQFKPVPGARAAKNISMPASGGMESLLVTGVQELRSGRFW